MASRSYYKHVPPEVGNALTTQLFSNSIRDRIISQTLKLVKIHDCKADPVLSILSSVFVKGTHTCVCVHMAFKQRSFISKSIIFLTKPTSFHLRPLIVLSMLTTLGKESVRSTDVQISDQCSAERKRGMSLARPHTKNTIP